MALAHVLIADITGSTALYEQLPEAEAHAQISILLSGMREIIKDNGGDCVKSKGDDTLSLFDDADQVFAAARQMIETDWENGLSLHVGAYWGDFMRQDTEIYGDAVNTAARLAALAKPREILIGDTIYNNLAEQTQALCVSMGGLKLKGKREPVRVHSFAVSDLDTQTVLFGAKDSSVDRRTESVALSCDGTSWTLNDGQSVLVGRSTDCDAVINHPWVSRKHGSFELRAAQLEYTDHSSSGSTVITADGQAFSLQRRSMPLIGEGMVLVGTRDTDNASSAVRYATNDLIPD